MATTKKKINDPFTVVKTNGKKNGSSKLEEVKTPKSLQKRIDEFNEINEQMKSLKGEQTACKNDIQEFSLNEYAKRSVDGKVSNFKLQGENSHVTFIAQNASSNIDQDTYDKLADKWGKKAVNALVRKDVSTVKIDPEVYEKHQDTINKALVELNKKIGESLFLAASYKVTKTVLNDAPEYAKDQDELAELLTELKVKTMIKAG